MTDNPRARVPLAEVIRSALQAERMEARFTLPGTVTKWIKPELGEDGLPRPAMAEVTIDFKAVRLGYAGDALDDETFRALPERLDGRGELSGPYPPLVLPISYPGGAEGRGRGPLRAGDGGKIVWTDRCLSRWLVASLAGQPIDPGDTWTRGDNLNDAVFEPGLTSGARIDLDQVKPVVPDDRWCWGPDNRTAEFSITADVQRTIRMITDGNTAQVDAAVEVLLGAAQQYAVMADALKDLLVNAATAAVAGVIPMDGGVGCFNAFKAFIAANAATIRSTKVKV